MSTILDKICAYKLDEVRAAKSDLTIRDLQDQINQQSPTRGFYQALQDKQQSGTYGLIAEIKKASPSKGLIREEFEPSQLATEYEKGGAACLSVLTDTPSFQGHPDYLISARQATQLPVLRKDFMLDVYQVFEARAWGADCILIIMACVSDTQGADLESAALELDMDVLLEVHDADELERALSLSSPLIGINNRNLKTFETNLAITEELVGHIPSEKLVVSESGLFTPDDLARMKKCGVTTFLIGESLMRAPDVAKATSALLAG